MRTVVLADLVAVARALLAMPPERRGPALEAMLYHAHAAHCIAKRLGNRHGRWGRGSLGEAASRLPQKREPFASDPDYLDVLALVIDALRRRVGHRPAKRAVTER